MNDFGFEKGARPDWVPAPLAEPSEHVPSHDPAFQFEARTTKAILAGFAFNHRVLIQGLHGSGKSSHVEQVAARLNWPLMRVNLDSHVSRLDLIGKDAIVLQDGQQVTAFQEGILPWAMQRPMALLLDEYDAGRPDVLFVIQRLLEAEGKLTLADQNRVIDPHPQFRLFATCNTLGLGDETGLYAGTQVLNQAQLDRWTTVCRLDFMAEASEVRLLLEKGASTSHRNNRGETVIEIMSRPWNDELAGFYTGLGNLTGLKVDLDRLKQERPKIAELLRRHTSQ